MERQVNEAFSQALNGGRFDEALFIEQITAKVVKSQQAHDSFSAKQLIDILQRAEAALRHTTSTCETQTPAIEFGESSKKLRERTSELRDGYERLYDEFRSLDIQVARVSGTAARIGERLETLEQHRRRAAEIVQLLKHFSQLNAPVINTSGTSSNVPLDSVFTDATRLFELAKVVKALAPVARELDSDSQATAKGRKEVSKLVSFVETSLLEKFAAAESSGSLTKMKEVAEAMTSFNGGDSLISRFIQTRSLFTDTNSRSSDEELSRSPPPAAIISPIPQPSSNKAESNQKFPQQAPEDSRIVEFSNRILRSLKKEHTVIVSVFPRPAAVMSLLVQKVLELRVRPFIDAIVFRNNVGHLEFVKVLYSMFGTLNSFLFNGLKEYSENTSGLNLDTFSDAFFASYLWLTTPDGQPHPQSYIVQETESMAEIYNSALRLFDKKKRVLEKVGLKEAQPGDAEAMPGEASDELVSIQTVLEFIHANESAVSRCISLSRKGELAANVGKLFRLMLQFVLLEYTNAALTSMSNLVAIAAASQQNLSSNIDLTLPIHAVSSFMRFVQVATQVVVLIQRHYQDSIVIHFVGNNNEATQCQDQLEQLINLIEGKVITGLTSCVDAISIHTGKILSEQGKTNYKLRDEDLSADLRPTNTCKQVVKFIDTQREIVERYLDGRNVRAFLTEVASKMLQLLINNLKRFVVTSTGGILIMRDVTEYRDCVNRFNSPAATRQHELLSDIAKIYLVAPEHLKSLVEDSPLSKLDSMQLGDLIHARSDWKETWIGKWM